MAFILGSPKSRTLGYFLTRADTDLVISQDLLVPLWRTGALAGRAYEVFVSELPASELQTRLDAASATHPQASSLRDFRVESKWKKDEWDALASARMCVTAHSAIHKVLEKAGISVTLVPWIEPPTTPITKKPNGNLSTVAFAGSALARKGAIEVASVARRLGIRVLILGSPPCETQIWEGVNWSSVGYDSDWLQISDVVVLPAYVEHQPRALLKALAAGIPVIASADCGLGTRNGLNEVNPGDVYGLEKRLMEILTNCHIAS